MDSPTRDKELVHWEGLVVCKSFFRVDISFYRKYPPKFLSSIQGHIENIPKSIEYLEYLFAKPGLYVRPLFFFFMCFFFRFFSAAGQGGKRTKTP